MLADVVGQQDLPLSIDHDSRISRSPALTVEQADGEPSVTARTSLIDDTREASINHPLATLDHVAHGPAGPTPISSADSLQGKARSDIDEDISRAEAAQIPSIDSNAVIEDEIVGCLEPARKRRRTGRTATEGEVTSELPAADEIVASEPAATDAVVLEPTSTTGEGVLLPPTRSKRGRAAKGPGKTIAPRKRTTWKTHEGPPVRRRRKAREPTPEEAENEVIVPAEVKMADLCRDTRKGKKSNRERQLAEREREKAKGTQEDGETRQSRRPAPQEGDDVEPPEQSAEDVTPTPRRRGRAAPGLRWVNGTMVIDDQTLQVDRHADAIENGDPMEDVEENELTRRITSQTWLKREKKELWGEILTDRFYLGLRMFGTDFMTISKMFPGRTRRQIKLKFNREERADSERIKEAVMGPKEPMDLSELIANGDIEYEDPAEFQRQLEREAQEHAEAIRRQEDHVQEMLRQKRAKDVVAANILREAGRDEDNDGEDDHQRAAAPDPLNDQEDQPSTKRGQKSAGVALAKQTSKKQKPTKKMHSRFGGGEEVEVIGTI